MNKLIIGVSVVLALLSCVNQNSANKANNNIDSVQKKQINQENERKNNILDTLFFGKRLYIEDTTKYSLLFINELKSSYSQYDSIRVFGDSLYVFSGIDRETKAAFLVKYSLPLELELYKETNYTTESNDKHFTLNLKRTNYTNIEYTLKENEKSIKFGVASLQGSFYFGPESDDDEKGQAFFLHQYIDNSNCGAILKIEFETAERATIAFCRNEKSTEYERIPMLKRE